MNHCGGRTDHVHRPFFLPFQTATASLERGDYSKPEGGSNKSRVGRIPKIRPFQLRISGPVDGTIADLTTVQVDRFGMKDDDATPEPHV